MEKSQWHIEEEQIIRRLRRMCKQGQLIELPLYKGTMKARFVDATAVKHYAGNKYKAILYTVSSGSGVIRTWIPLESERFQNDGRATEMNTDGRNHTPDAIELCILRHKLTQTQGVWVKQQVEEFVDRFKTMVENGGWKPSKGAYIRLLEEVGYEATSALRELFNEEHNGPGSGVYTGAAKQLDEAAFEALKKLGWDHAIYPDYYCGYELK